MIYFDSAATTLEKPDSVGRAMMYALKNCSSPGRGRGSSGMKAGELIYRCREQAAQLFDVSDPAQVVFTFNATHGLNIAIRSLVKAGNTVLISGYEHNAVTRVLHSIPGVTIKVAATKLFDANAAYQGFEQLLTDDVDVVICCHVSNVFGFILPMDQIAELCKKKGKPLIVDASQSAGTLPVSLEKWGAYFIAMPGHKGLYGPQGTGILLCQSEASPLLCGGTGGESLIQDMPKHLPERLEAGTPNVCGLAGLLAGMEFVSRKTIYAIGQHERLLCRKMIQLLKQFPSIKVYEGEQQAGLFSFVTKQEDCEEFGEKLGRRGIAMRTGLHCAPLAHKTGGTLESGTVRVSFSAFNNMKQVQQVAKVINTILMEKRAS